ncbi:PHB depolymerase family esterase [Kitasatospora sp. NPDC096147]|uniref:extracellular catalytic domain type 1 short-chain-length polyhydroxyalkanoate depolymerase n=1 Tax=Kitasatospora sp. NPDC096147 TaxID=3364093 RepID=UPI003804E53D
MRVRPQRARWAAVLTLLAALAAAFHPLSPAPARAAAVLTQVTGFGSNPGNLLMYRHVPDGLPAGRPLVVALHGCTQSAAAYDDETGWTKWAERYGFALVLPQQQSANNSSGCFNWFQPGDFSRDQGEALSVRQMVARSVADLATDPARVYVTGLSAGGAMTAALLADYPDVFAGGAVVAGLPYRCAASQVQASVDCMSTGRDLTPAQWGDLVRSGHPSWTGPWPKVSIWHGSSDALVKPSNLTELMEQWTDANGISRTPALSETVDGHPHRVYADVNGQARVETWSITGMGHGQPVDPGSGAEQCGTAGAYLLDVNLCASYRIATFLSLNGTSTTPSPTPFPTPSPSPSPSGPGTLTLPDDTTRDGYVKANADGSSPAVGTLAGTLGLAVGRGTDGRQNRALLSFDTSALPPGATVTAARLTVTRASGSGDPWSGAQLTVSTRTGCFGPDCTTTPEDYAAPADAPDTATVPAVTTGTATSTTFHPTVTPGVPLQLRLAFDRPLPATAYAFLQRGPAATLTLEYRS